MSAWEDWAITFAFGIAVSGVLIMALVMPENPPCDITLLKEQNYAKCLDVCLYDSNETLVKVSKAYCVQQCNR